MVEFQQDAQERNHGHAGAAPKRVSLDVRRAATSVAAWIRSSQISTPVARHVNITLWSIGPCIPECRALGRTDSCDLRRERVDRPEMRRPPKRYGPPGPWHLSTCRPQMNE